MGKSKKKTSSGKISNGGRQKANVHHEEVRQAKFAKKRENGTEYKWTPNPFKKGTDEYREEEYARANKNVDRRDEYSVRKSVMRKLQNELNKKAFEAKKASENRRNNK